MIYNTVIFIGGKPLTLSFKEAKGRIYFFGGAITTLSGFGIHIEKVIEPRSFNYKYKDTKDMLIEHITDSLKDKNYHVDNKMHQLIRDFVLRKKDHRYYDESFFLEEK